MNVTVIIRCENPITYGALVGTTLGSAISSVVSKGHAEVEYKRDRIRIVVSETDETLLRTVYSIRAEIFRQETIRLDNERRATAKRVQKTLAQLKGFTWGSSRKGVCCHV